MMMRYDQTEVAPLSAGEKPMPAPAKGAEPGKLKSIAKAIITLTKVARDVVWLSMGADYVRRPSRPALLR
jgi:hypothetical protein